MHFMRSVGRLLPNLTWSGVCRLSHHCEKFSENMILKNTVVTKNHLTPEMQLRLITSDCEIWNAKYNDSEFSSDPFWGIYWPGGQALARFILDNKDVVFKKNVMDIGSGSGACALAAAMSGAKTVLANDIDPMSITAIEMNSDLNNVKVYTCSVDLIGEDIDTTAIITDKNPMTWDVILIGDMFYDTAFSCKLFHWLVKLVKKGKMVFVGDPGRHALKDIDKLTSIGGMVKVAEYSFHEIEHNGFPTAAVYKVEAS